MKYSLIPILGVILWHASAVAQNDIPLLRPEERQAVDSQTNEFNQSLIPILGTAAKSTVRIWTGNRRLAYGTVIGDGTQILTKWSEASRAAGAITVEPSAGEARSGRITGIYLQEDLALVTIDGPPLTPVTWSKDPPQLGAFLAAPQPNGRPAAFGVVSVLERNLRDTDQAYLGISGLRDFTGPGVKIAEIEPQSGAASAGLQPGDIILKIGDRSISGLLELRNALTDTSPGATVNLLVQTNRGEKKVSIQLGKRPPQPNFMGARLQQMEQMGGPISRVRDSFSHVIQSDMRPQPDQVGGPVVDLKGHVIGITLARADRTRSFIMSAAAVESLLQQKPRDPSLAQLSRNSNRQSPPAIGRTPHHRRQPANEEQLRRQLMRMQSLRELMREEMQGLDPEP